MFAHYPAMVVYTLEGGYLINGFYELINILENAAETPCGLATYTIKMAAHSAKHQTNYEYLLMGGLPEGQLDSLLNRLRGLCDHNHLLEFSDREILYGLSKCQEEMNTLRLA